MGRHNKRLDRFKVNAAAAARRITELKAKQALPAQPSAAADAPETEDPYTRLRKKLDADRAARLGNA